MLAACREPAQEAVVTSMLTIARQLSVQPSSEWTTRQPAPGDIGWVIERHGAVYAEEYGLNHRFEALVAQIAGAFLNEQDPAREQGWIAEWDGVRVGSVFLMRETDDIGKLRLLLVEPTARGMGMGKQLVDECIAFARQVGYRRMTLWTNDILIAARGIYRAAGFRLISSMFRIAISDRRWWARSGNSIFSAASGARVDLSTVRIRSGFRGDAR